MQRRTRESEGGKRWRREGWSTEAWNGMEEGEKRKEKKDETNL